MPTTAGLLVSFIASMVVSTIIIYAVVKLLGEKEGVDTVALAALVGSVIYAVSYFFLSPGLLAAFIGGIFWLAALGSLYRMGWPKALLVAVVVWIFASVVSLILPTLAGPL